MFSFRNTPFQISADPGTLLIGAKNKTILELLKIANDVKAYYPTEAPWCKGAVEAIIKQLKLSLKTLPGIDMSLLEFKTLIDHIVCSINNRPLGICRDLVQPMT